ncbi:hypothetical protein MUK42_31046 [Musa troglodytarum]|uniref:Uncharacterized protein n=1 Tax=Musa troglodytarum TaxID=320322 RepID=A0A9E7GSE4_9LILI|nr:hypothetical protein MUK42_31046 [Musa troglodytarum]
MSIPGANNGRASPMRRTSNGHNGKGGSFLTRINRCIEIRPFTRPTLPLFSPVPEFFSALPRHTRFATRWPVALFPALRVRDRENDTAHTRRGIEEGERKRVEIGSPAPPLLLLQPDALAGLVPSTLCLGLIWVPSSPRILAFPCSKARLTMPYEHGRTDNIFEKSADRRIRSTFRRSVDQDNYKFCSKVGDFVVWNIVLNASFHVIVVDSSFDGSNSDIGENSSDDTVMRSPIKDESQPSSSEGEIFSPSKELIQHESSSHTTVNLCSVNSDISKNCYTSDAYLSNDVLDACSSTERADCSSQAGSNDDFQPVIAGKRAVHSEIGQTPTAMNQIGHRQIEGNSEVGTTKYRESSSLSSSAGNLIQKWVPVGRKDSVYSDTGYFEKVSIRDDATTDQSYPNAAGLDGEFSNPGASKLIKKLSSCPRSANKASDLHAEINFQTHEMKDKEFNGVATELDKIIQAVNDAYKLQTVAEEEIFDKSIHMDHAELIFEYFESDQPPWRRPLYEKIKELVSGDRLPASCIFGDPLKLESVKLHDLHPASWCRDDDKSWDVEEGENWFQPRDMDMKVFHSEDAHFSNASDLLKERLRTLKQTASVMARAVVHKRDQRSANRHPDYEFFVSRSW